MDQSHLHLDSDYAAGAESSNVKNVLVLGGSYGGMHAASVLANKLPPSHRVILIERNSHFNHLYAFPRFSVLPGHAHKAYVPFSHIFRDSPARRQSRKKAKTNLQDQSEGPSLRLQSKSKRRSSESLDSSTNSKSEVEGSISSKTSNSSPSTAATELGESWSETRLESASSKAGAVGIATSIAREGSNVVEKNQNQAERPPIVVEDLKEALESGDGAEHLTQGINAVEEQNEEEDPESESEEGVEAAPHIVLQASVTRITDTHVLVTPQATKDTSQAEQKKKKLWGIDSLSIPYTHLIYALGSHLPDPLRSEARTKSEGISWMESMQDRIRESQKIVLVGGGPLGVQLATDIASTYSKEEEKKQITLIHSRKQLLPNFDFKIHEIALERLKELGVNVVLGERLATTEGCPRGSGVKEDNSTSNANLSRNTSPESSNLPPLLPHQKRITTTSGSNFTADLLLLCTGQQPSSSILADFSPSSVDPSSRLIRVRSTLQIALPERDEGLLSQMPFDFKAPCGDCDCFLDKKVAGKDQDEGSNSNEVREGEKKKHTLCFTNMYAIGDVANAFGALNAGYQAWAMADIAAGNILLDIQSSSSTQDQDQDRTSEDSETALKPLNFVPAPNLLKLSLGLGKVAHQGAPVKKVEGEGSNRVETEEVPVEVKEEDEDLGVKLVWQYMALAPTEDMHL